MNNNYIQLKKFGTRLLGGAFAGLLFIHSAWALEPAADEVLLVIDGNISESNATEDGKPVAEFDLKMLKSFEATTFTTSSAWTEISTYTGVRLNTLLATVGADLDTDQVHAYALDDYWWKMKGIKANDYPIIVAYEKNGEPMSLRELGPLWIVFPWDDYPELNTSTNKSASVWQLLRFTVK